jgi:DNA repair exonuclease SbcCD ATPase subunit
MTRIGRVASAVAIGSLPRALGSFLWKKKLSKDGEDDIKELLDQLSSLNEKVSDEYTAEAKTYEDFACSSKESLDKLQADIDTANTDFDTALGELQDARLQIATLLGDASENTSIAYDKEQLEITKATWLAAKKKHEAEILDAETRITESEEALDLVAKSITALKDAAEKVLAANEQSTLDFLQTSSKHASPAMDELFESLKKDLSSTGLMQTGTADTYDVAQHDSGNNAVVKILNNFRDKLNTLLSEARSDLQQASTDLADAKNTFKMETASYSKSKKEKEAKLADEQARAKGLEEEMRDVRNSISTMQGQAMKVTSDGKDAKAEFEREKAEYTGELAALKQAYDTIVAEYGSGGEKFSRPMNATDYAPSPPPECGTSGVTITPQTAAEPLHATSFMQFGMTAMQKRYQDATVQKAISLLSTAQEDLFDRSKGGAILLSVISSLKAKPLEKVIIMIRNLIQKLKDEEANDQKRHLYCSTHEKEIQDARTSAKEQIEMSNKKSREAQAQYADAKTRWEELQAQLDDTEKTCDEGLTEMTTSENLMNAKVTEATRAITTLSGVISKLQKDFYNEGTGSGEVVLGLIQSLVDEQTAVKEASDTELAKLSTSIAKLKSTTQNTVAAKEGEQSSIMTTEIMTAQDSFGTNSKDLFNSAQELSTQTENLITLFGSEACGGGGNTEGNKHKQKIEDMKAEIAALKGALEVLSSRPAL